MRLQEYKKLMTKAFTNNTRRGFVDWRDCGKLYMDVTEGLEGAADELCAENRYSDLFSLANRTYVKWNSTVAVHFPSADTLRILEYGLDLPIRRSKLLLGEA